MSKLPTWALRRLKCVALAAPSSTPVMVKHDGHVVLEVRTDDLRS